MGSVVAAAGGGSEQACPANLVRGRGRQFGLAQLPRLSVSLLMIGGHINWFGKIRVGESKESDLGLAELMSTSLTRQKKKLKW